MERIQTLSRRVIWLVAIMIAALTFAGGDGLRAQSGGAGARQQPMPKMTNAQRRAAADRAKAARAAKAVTTTSRLSTSALVAAAVAPLPGGTPDYFGPYSNYANSPLPSGPMTITIASGGAFYSAVPVVTIADVVGVGPTVTTTATVVGGAITAIAAPPGNYAAPVITIADTTGSGASASATITPIAGGLRKFIDALPDLKGLIATPDVVTYPGSDYYEVELVDYTNWSFHSDLGTTKLRGYRQTNFGTDTAACGTACTAASNTVAPPALPSYLGPVIVATKDRPTRIKFTNHLASGTAGDLFIPTDTTVMGAGVGPDGVSSYQQNRATLHLHGGLTPWVSDGTPHQWTVPGSDVLSTPYPTGVSTQPVPDMPVPAGGSMTFYWPNQQSGRLMFYHDHAYGTTRLNVYAGEAAGYLLRDATDVDLENRGVIPPLGDNIPLVIQDKTFVWGTPSPASGTFATDPTWNWGTAQGSLWFPHVYMPNQNPWDMSGANAMGRWDYALWFWPPYNGILKHGTLPNPYAANPGEPPEIPGTPNPSLVPEAFMDTPLVNGKAYPVLQVSPKAYRLRILNAANDRFFNLSLFVAADKTSPTTAGTSGARMCTGAVAAANCTEVKMVPFNSTQNALSPFPAWWYSPGNSFSLDDRVGGVPDPLTVGPEMIQIGTEGGLLPAPVVLHNQPVNYAYDRRNIVVLNVQEKALFLGPAERADVIVDFSQFAGKTLILYSDAPAPVPASDPRLDYYTGNPDQTDVGGAPTTQPGYGPNTRTLMQIQVGGTTNGTPFNLIALQDAFKTTATSAGVFATSQDPILVAQAAYSSAYNGVFPNGVGTPAAFARIQDTAMSFATITGNTMTAFPLQPKAIQELFEVDYGRMNATLGIELPFTNANNQTTIPYGYIDPATEILTDSITPLAPAAGDGTQLWKITHNGVDTHAIHFHLFNVQVVNRVGWDGAIRPPDDNELGWKETVRMNPLEDIIVAMRPIAPKLPFGVPDSQRLLNPAMPVGAPMDSFDPLTGAPITIANALFNFGWEYVWHCHLLGHEENDMMRPLAFTVRSAVPPAPVLTGTGLGPFFLSWVDGTPAASATTLGDPANEIGFRIERANGTTGAFAAIATTIANATSYTDPLVTTGLFRYRVVAFNAAGATASNIVTLGPPVPAAPTNLTATALSSSQVRLNWTDTSNNETNFRIQRATGTTGVFAVLATLGANVVTYTDNTAAASTLYRYQVFAVNASGSAGSNIATVTTPAPPPPLAMDVTVVAKPTVASRTVATAPFSTTQPNELLLAFVATDYLTGANTTVTGITGGGLTWQLVVRSNGQLGTSEIWRAFATTPLAGATVTATLSQPVVSLLTVVTFTGADRTGTNGSGAIGAVRAANSAVGAPTASVVTTRTNSWVFGVGNDFSSAVARTPGANQTIVSQYLPAVGDTYWVQRQNAPTPLQGTTVRINDTAPNYDRYNLAICEILQSK
jgi:FtsP/CotA-like multicopper oxidase with cupredoxin domain